VTRLVTYSPKVFIPLTKLCRDVCHYCTFARPPRRGERAYMSAEEVLAIARAGAAAGCHEALFTLGDKPELRYRAARAELAALGCQTTIEYLARMCELVLEETGLLPHANPGVMTREELALLRTVTASQGIMLETASGRLSEPGGPHYGSPDKLPAQARDDPACGGARDPVHDRDPDRDRGDPRRARRGARGDQGAARALRAHPGGDRPELPREARHEDGPPSGAVAGRPPLDGAGGA